MTKTYFDILDELEKVYGAKCSCDVKIVEPPPDDERKPSLCVFGDTKLKSRPIYYMGVPAWECDCDPASKQMMIYIRSGEAKEKLAGTDSGKLFRKLLESGWQGHYTRDLRTGIFAGGMGEPGAWLGGVSRKFDC